MTKGWRQLARTTTSTSIGHPPGKACAHNLPASRRMWREITKSREFTSIASVIQASLERFGRDPLEAPAEWDQFRRDQVNLTAKAAYRAMVDIDPNLTMSAAV